MKNVTAFLICVTLSVCEELFQCLFTAFHSGWLNDLFRFLAHRLWRLRDLAPVVEGSRDVFGNQVLCGFCIPTCTFTYLGDDAKLPRVVPAEQQEWLAAQPADLRKHGSSRYFGNRGVRKQETLIPSVSDESLARFLETAINRLATMFFVELERYGVAPELEQQSCDIGLGPTHVEGVLATAKRGCQQVGHMRTRDELMRAHVCSKEVWLDPSRFEVSAELLKVLRLANEPETTRGRKERLGEQGLARLNEVRKAEQGRADRRSARAGRKQTTPLIFSFDCLPKADLIVQAAKRGAKSSYKRTTEELRTWLVKHDGSEMSLATLQEEAQQRGDTSAIHKDKNKVLAFLRRVDKKAESKRYEEMKELRKRKRAEEESQEDEETEEESV